VHASQAEFKLTRAEPRRPAVKAAITAIVELPGSFAQSRHCAPSRSRPNPAVTISDAKHPNIMQAPVFVRQERAVLSASGKILAGGVAALFCFSPSIAQEAVTTREREALPPRSANSSVRRDLLSVLKPLGKIRSGMFRQLRGVGLTTRPFGTEFEGLCRRDAVTLLYAATQTAPQPEDAPLLPYSVEAQPWFHIIHLPKNAPSDARSGEGVWQAKCASADKSNDMSWFAARDARVAMQGALVLEAAVKAVRLGTLKAEPCSNIIDVGKSTC
jgi:hypothetical protein